MSFKSNKENVYLGIITPVAAAAALWAIYDFPVERFSWHLIILAIVTIFFSSALRIQLPRINIHVTISDAAIILAFVVYGGETSVLLAILESAFTSLSYKWRGGRIRNKTIATNITIATVAVFLSSIIIRVAFGPAPTITESGNVTMFIWLLAVMAALLFLFNSALISLFVTAKSDEKSIVTVWSEYCLNALVIYMTSAVLAGVSLKAMQQINTTLFAAVGLFFGIVYFTYRRYINDIKSTSAQAEQAERGRAEQAEQHVAELRHYVQKLEESSQQLQTSHETLRHALYHSALTGMPNKHYFAEKIKDLLAECRQSLGRPFAVLYLDLNRFKTINDSIGHARGDKLIQSVGARIKELTGPNEIVGHFGGDEFAVLMTEVRNERDVVSFAERISESLSEPFQLFGRNIFTSACVGIAFGNGSYKRAINILRDVDIAMYHAKESGKHYVIFDEEMHADAVNLLQLETDLRLAIERKEFEVYYQPIVSITEMELVGFEALVRWNHPTKGIIQPSHFVGVSESTDLVIPLTLQVLEQSCRTVGSWNNDRPERPLFVSVNLSGRHFDQPDLVGQINSVLDETKFQPQNLKLEITETALMHNADASVQMLNQLKSSGIRISIDDFGTGYSSLNYLHRFPLDVLKVDRSFVCSAITSNENREIIRTIVYLAQALNLEVVAEGVENIAQLEMLRTLGCEFAQGYLFSRPLPAGQVEALIHDRSMLSGIGYSTAESPSSEYHPLRLLG
jgi:diguanylate cyclase (GGDEF)-like protein